MVGFILELTASSFIDKNCNTNNVSECKFDITGGECKINTVVHKQNDPHLDLML